MRDRKPVARAACLSRRGARPSRNVRAGLLAVCALTTLGSAALQAQPAPKPRRPKVLPGRAVELKTQDGWTLAAQYAPGKPGRPTFVLLHQTGGRKEDWYYLARAMVRRGMGVLALDLRGHGGSQNPPPGSESHWRKFRAQSRGDNEWVKMNQDVESAVSYLTSEGVAAGAIAAAGADVGSSIALRYAAVHPEVPLVFLLSPGMSYREVLTVNALRAYSHRPILMVVGADDRRSLTETGLLFSIARLSAGERNASLLTADREHGVRMLFVNKGLITRILDWVENPVQPEVPQTSTDTTSSALQATPQTSTGAAIPPQTPPRTPTDTAAFPSLELPPLEPPQPEDEFGAGND